MKIQKIVQESPSVKTFILEEGFDFKAGQYIIVKFPGEDQGKAFSIATSPSEKILAFSTNIRETDFKVKLNDLKEEDELEIQGPYGYFHLDESISKPVMMIAGGIGITPFRSMIKSALDTEFPIMITLLHSIKTKDDAIYKEDFDSWEETDKFWYIPTLTQSEPTDWEGELGRVSKEMIERHASGEYMFYVCGSSGFVDSIIEILREKMNIQPELIKTETFPGY